jgi:hypothetical protein
MIKPVRSCKLDNIRRNIRTNVYCPNETKMLDLTYTNQTLKVSLIKKVLNKRENL